MIVIDKKNKYVDKKIDTIYERVFFDENGKRIWHIHIDSKGREVEIKRR